LSTLDVMDGIKHDHAFGYVGGVLMKFTVLGIATPDFENGGFQEVERLNG